MPTESQVHLGHSFAILSITWLLPPKSPLYLANSRQAVIGEHFYFEVDTRRREFEATQVTSINNRIGIGGVSNQFPADAFKSYDEIAKASVNPDGWQCLHSVSDVSYKSEANGKVHLN